MADWHRQQRGDLVASLARAIGVAASQVEGKYRKGTQMKANGVWEGSASPAAQPKKLLVAFPKDSPHLAVDGALNRLRLQASFPEAIVVASIVAGELRAKTYGYEDSQVAKKVAEVLGTELESVDRPTFMLPHRTAAELETGELLENLEKVPNLVLQGPPGTGKTSLALEMIEQVLRRKGSSGELEEFRYSTLWERAEQAGHDGVEDLLESEALDVPLVWELVQVHPAYSYEDLVRGIRPQPDASTIAFRAEDGLLPRLSRVADRLGGDKPVILILDEINRGRISAVLGELILALDPDYRGSPVRLQYQGEGLEPTIAIPRNLWLVGTMNTADRSIAFLDYAIRRRFRFVDVPASADAIRDWYYSDADQSAIAVELFNAINTGLDPSLQLGHSYFLVDQQPVEEWPGRLARRIAYEVAPQIVEYVRDALLASSTFSWDGTDWDAAEPRRLARDLTSRIASRLHGPD